MKFSIIVPVYNIKDYLETCINSVLKQRYQDFELILIDDGSDDGSEEICCRYAKENSSVKTVRQKRNVRSIKEKGKRNM